MTSITATAQRATAARAFSSRRVYAALTAGAFLVTALLLGVQSGHRSQATSVPA